MFCFRDEEIGGCTASVDGAWQKRGSGRSYDSLSGYSYFYNYANTHLTELRKSR